MSTLPSQKNLNAYYAKHFSYKNGLLNEIVIRKRSQTILKEINHFAPYAKTLCDVGSGYGFFLDEARNKGYITIGIDPSKQLANYAQRNYRVRTFVGGLKQYLNHEQKQFDVVTCIHVIEHVSNPKEFIRSLLALVKPGGLLYVETPNSDSHLLYAEKECYTFLLPPDHLWLFSKESMKYLFPKNTRTICVNTYSYSEHVMGILKAKNRSIFRKIETNNNPINWKYKTIGQVNNVKKRFFFYLFDRVLAPLFTGILNLYHKGSILELYIQKKGNKCGL